jgi:hypothetical protein
VTALAEIMKGLLRDLRLFDGERLVTAPGKGRLSST